jgi:ribosomal-protein-alanine N-acetyltransferase
VAEVLYGETVYLRPVEPRDAPELVQLQVENRDFFAPRDAPRPPEYFTLEGQQQFVEFVTKMREENRGVAFGIFVRDRDELIGVLMLFAIVRGGFQDARIGYMLAERHSGRGYATQAVRLAVAFAFDELDLHRLETGVQLDNPASARVLTKAGFRDEGVSRAWVHAGGDWADCTRFALTAEEWRHASAASATPAG